MGLHKFMKLITYISLPWFNLIVGNLLLEIHDGLLCLFDSLFFFFVLDSFLLPIFADLVYFAFKIRKHLVANILLYWIQFFKSQVFFHE